MNTGVTSKEAIMQVCRGIAAEKGLSALNMRAVARECHIALGTLYNYYSDKDELLIATVESVWKDMLHMNERCETALSFPDYAAWLFESIQRGAVKYPHFLTAHSISIAKSKKGRAKSTMEHDLGHMKAGMLAALLADPAVDPGIFSPSFTRSDLVDFVLDNILMLLVQGKANCTALLELIRRVVYR